MKVFQNISELINIYKNTRQRNTVIAIPSFGRHLYHHTSATSVSPHQV